MYFDIASSKYLIYLFGGSKYIVDCVKCFRIFFQKFIIITTNDSKDCH